MLALVLTPLTAGCPTPIPWTEVRAADVVGQYTTEDGTPVRGAAAAVSTESGDSTCARAGARTVTNATGGFALSLLERRQHRVAWIVPGLDLARPRYLLCVAPAGDTTTRRAHAGQGSRRETAPRDSVTCMAWAWQHRTRVTCGGPADPAIATGGHWSTGDGAGFYRVLLAEEPTRVRGYDAPMPRLRAFVQWVERGEAGRPATVRATALVPTDAAVYVEGGPTFVERDGGWQLRLDGTRKRVLTGWSPVFLTFALGAPGVVTAAPTP